MRHLLSHLLRWDFIRMGKGIEARYSRCASHWAPHLSCTREFIDQNVQPGGRLAVLGAGRLLDIDLHKLIPLFSEIHLFDADPSVMSTWRRMSGAAFRERVFPRVVDVTGSLGAWSEGLARAKRRGELVTYLESLKVDQGVWELEHFDGVISLNLIGQIPLYWRDRVLGVAGDISDEEERALVRSMAKLQAAHLRGLRSAPKGWAIAITDTEYYTYSVDRSEWEVEAAIDGEVLRDFRDSSPRTKESGDSCWLWHLAPQFVESEDSGEIHRVEARAWRVAAKATGTRHL